MGANHYSDLAAFRLCEELMRRLEEETAKEPLASHYRFCDQLNDAALDAASDVAEGFVRYYPREFARFLDHALASLAEVRTRTEAAYRRQWVSAAAASDVLNLCARSDTACRRAYLHSVRKADLPPRPVRERPHLRARHATRPRHAAAPPDDPDVPSE